jgi:hypothetical protein
MAVSPTEITRSQADHLAPQLVSARIGAAFYVVWGVLHLIAARGICEFASSIPDGPAHARLEQGGLNLGLFAVQTMWQCRAIGFEEISRAALRFQRRESISQRDHAEWYGRPNQRRPLHGQTRALPPRLSLGVSILDLPRAEGPRQGDLLSIVHGPGWSWRREAGRRVVYARASLDV